MKKFFVAAAILLMSFPVVAKKKEEKTGLKKVVAIGNVNAGMFSFQGSNPMGLSSLLQEQIKKQIDAATGLTAVIINPQAEEEEGAGDKNDEFLKQVQEKIEGGGQPTQAEMMRYSQLMMKQVAPMMQQFNTAPPKNIAAQAVLTFSTSTGSGTTDTGGALGQLGNIVNLPSSAGLADISTEKVKLSLTCIMHDPATGAVKDQKVVKKTKTKFHRIAGIQTFNNSFNHDEAYEKLFGKAVEECVEWVAAKLEKEPWEGKIFKVEGGKIFLNAGASAGVQPGMQFSLSKRGSVSGGGIEFGKAEQSAGQATVQQVQEGYSILNAPESGSVSVGAVAHPSP